jgi:cellulose synthase/poly-beta-1,6-N-acetylglucosamine synthase-like glycosyltransferase
VIGILFRKRIFLGYAASALSASLTLHITINTLSGGGNGGLSLNMVVYLFLLVFVTLYTVVPSLLFIAYCERRTIRKAAFYVLFSAVLAFVGLPVIFLNVDWEIFKTALMFTPAGIVSGLVYWYLAGRLAGDDARLLRAQLEAFD